ncbi:hypothetical protein BH708_11530 [Brachybacterium sp. P6-10-X1]|uniref:DinB family protein n=1 Tax=Brachybacterium sp. P6-10-X1 TaxID=1903186 RepID=UPI0009719053|nr:DinB family protein [Brachybacterium sp. P6-10-X1]APX33239.1 hypothetical protein BH708_11530 [Brachybacterium sp. P6-10-X1]
MSGEIKEELHRKLQVARAHVLENLEGLDEYDLRRPLTPTGTNLLGLVKHLAGLEYGYLGSCLAREPGETLSWVEDDSIWEGADMWARPEESSAYLVDLYRRAGAHADSSIETLDLDAPAQVPWWDDPSTTLGVLLVRMLAETAQHAGHADIVRELIDGRVGNTEDQVGDDPEFWSRFSHRIQGAADQFRRP